jgi:hypothetical protein
MKNLKKFLLVSLGLLLGSCSSEPPYWSNLYLQVKPGNLSEIEVTKNINNGWSIEENCENYCVILETWLGANGKPMYKLEYVGEFEFNFAYFSGFNNIRIDAKGQAFEDTSAEMKFIEKTAFGFIATGELKVADSYQISLSKSKV